MKNIKTLAALSAAVMAISSFGAVSAFAESAAAPTDSQAAASDEKQPPVQAIGKDESTPASSNVSTVESTAESTAESTVSDSTAESSAAESQPDSSAISAAESTAESKADVSDASTVDSSAASTSSADSKAEAVITVVGRDPFKGVFYYFDNTGKFVKAVDTDGKDVTANGAPTGYIYDVDDTKSPWEIIVYNSNGKEVKRAATDVKSTTLKDLDEAAKKVIQPMIDADKKNTKDSNNNPKTGAATAGVTAVAVLAAATAVISKKRK